MAQSIVRLYYSENNSWAFSGTSGILTLHFEQQLPAVYLRITDLKTKKVVLIQECYAEFLSTYQILSSNFHSFEAEEMMIGLCFAEGFDAARWNQMMSGLVKKAGDIKAPQTSNPQTIQKKTVTSEKTLQPQKKEEPQNTSGFFSNIFGGWGKKKEPEPQEVKRKLKISGPSNVVHIAGFGNHFGDSNSGKIPDDWIDIFKKAGLTEKEMKDEKVAKFVVDTIIASEDQQVKKKIMEEAQKVEETEPVETVEQPQVEETKVEQPIGGGPPPPPKPPGPPPPKAPKKEGETAPKKEKAPVPEGRSNLLESIQKGTTLRKVDMSEKVKKMDESEKNDLASTIAAAMKIRREVVEEEDEEGDEW